MFCKISNSRLMDLSMQDCSIESRKKSYLNRYGSISFERRRLDLPMRGFSEKYQEKLMYVGCTTTKKLCMTFFPKKIVNKTIKARYA